MQASGSQRRSDQYCPGERHRSGGLLMHMTPHVKGSRPVAVDTCEEEAATDTTLHFFLKRPWSVRS